MKGTRKKLLILSLTAFLFLFSFQAVFAADTQLVNPIGGTSGEPTGTTDPRVIIGYVINGILGIVGSLALLIFIYGGFTWIISQGNEEKITKGKNMIIWASLGLAVIFFSYALVNFVITAIVGSSSSTGGGDSSKTTIQTTGTGESTVESTGWVDRIRSGWDTVTSWF